MIRKKKKNFNLYVDDIDYMDGMEEFDEKLDYQADDKKNSDSEEVNEPEETAENQMQEEDAKASKKEKGASRKFFGKKKKNREQENVSHDDGMDGDAGEKKPISKKKIAVAVGAAVVVVGVIGWFIVGNLNSGDEGKAYVESVSTVTGLGSANGMNNRYTGEVEAQDSWKITLQSDMSVAKCYVEVGDQVKKGDKLFSYNTEELKLNKEKKDLEVETLQNEINQLNKDIKGYQEDLKNASASEKIELQTQILTAQTTIKKDEYSIKSGKEEIKTLEKNIKDATVKSKMDGVVKKINTSLGQASSDTETEMDDSSGDSSVYMTILAVGDYRIKGKISETNVWSLSEGTSMIVRSRVDETKTWRGTVSKINTDSTSESESSDASEMNYDMEGTGETASSYDFYVQLDDDDGLMMGQHVLLEQDNGQEEGKSGLWLPSAYVHIDGDNYYVWVANKRDRLELQKIEVGEYNEELEEYEILEGLDLDDYIACDGENLKENMKTEKVDNTGENDGYNEEGSSDDYIYQDDMSGEEYYEEDGYEEDTIIDDTITE